MTISGTSGSFVAVLHVSNMSARSIAILKVEAWSKAECLRAWPSGGVGHLDHVRSYGEREVVSSIPDQGNIVA